MTIQPVNSVDNNPVTTNPSNTDPSADLKSEIMQFFQDIIGAVEDLLGAFSDLLQIAENDNTPSAPPAPTPTPDAAPVATAPVDPTPVSPVTPSPASDQQLMDEIQADLKDAIKKLNDASDVLLQLLNLESKPAAKAG